MKNFILPLCFFIAGISTSYAQTVTPAAPDFGYADAGVIAVNHFLEINNDTTEITLATFSYFGRSVENLGDLDGSGAGVTTIAVGATGNNGTGGFARGAVYLINLNADGTILGTPVEINSDHTEITLADNDNFGTSIANLGDLDGAGVGVTTIAVGITGDDTEGVEKGAIYLINLRSTGVIEGTPVKITTNTTGITLPNRGAFGFSIANLGDLDVGLSSATDKTNSLVTIAVGAGGDDTGGVDAGAIYIINLDSAGAIVGTAVKIDNNRSKIILSGLDRFGFSIADLGDLDGSGAGVTTIAVGAEGDDTGGGERGALYLINLRSTGVIEGTPVKITTDTTGITLANNEGFGASVIDLGDLDGGGAGVKTIAVGTTLREKIYIINLNASGAIIGTVGVINNAALSTTIEDSDEFGNSIASIGDINGDGIDEIVIGEKNEDAGEQDSGEIHIISFAKKQYSFTTADNVNITLPAVEVGSPAPTYTLSPTTLPAGLSFDGTARTITGTPTAISAATEYTLTATNSAGSNTFVFNLGVGVAAASTNSLPTISSIILATTAAPSRDQTITVTDADNTDTLTAHWTYIDVAANCNHTNFSTGGTELTLSGSSADNSAGRTATITYSGVENNTKFICVRASDGTGSNGLTYATSVNAISGLAAPTITINTIEGDDWVNAAEVSSVQISGTSTGIPNNGEIDLTFDVSDVNVGIATVTNNAWSYTIPQLQSSLLPQTQVTVTAEYTGATAVERTFDVDAVLPRLVTEIPDQTATVGTAFSFPIPANTFTDTNTITYTSSGEANGISFNTATNTWEGTPTTAETQTITVTAIDAAGNTRTDEFDIVISAASGTTPTITIRTISDDGYVNDAEDERDVPLGGVTTNITEGQIVSITVSDTDSSTADVTKTSAVDDDFGIWGANIHSVDLKTLAEGTITVTASYPGATNAIQTFVYDATAPTLAAEIPDQTAATGTAFTFPIPANTFTDTNTITYTSSGEANGISFTTDTWSGTPNNAETLSITVTATDAAGNIATDTFDIVISGNSAPTGITLSSASVAENTTDVGTFSTTDEVGDTHTYELVAGSGAEDNGKFTLSTIGELSFTAAPDFETPTDAGDTANNNTYAIRVQTSDQDSETFAKEFTITVTNVVEQATFTIDAIADASVSEGVVYTSSTPALSGGTPIGTVTYTKSGADSDDFTINSSTGVVSMVARDYETPEDADTSNDYEITITATDGDGNTATQSWTVSVTDYVELAGASMIPALWVKANEGITEASNVITGWTDQSPSAEAGVPTGSPVLSSSFINFNPTVLFDGTDDYFDFNNPSTIKNRDNFTFIAVAGANDISSVAHQHLLGTDHQNGARITLRAGNIALHRSSAGDLILDEDPPIAAGDIGIVAVSRSGSNGNDFTSYQDGAEFTRTSTNAAYTFAANTASTYIGRRARSGEMLNGQVAELVVFEDVLSAADLDKIQTHLAIKYGITLDSDVANYVNAAGTSVFDNSGTYVNDIVGIAKDDTSVLDQRISKSKNDGSILIISTDATFTGENSGHADSLTDGQYLVIGNNGGALATQTSELPSGTINRVAREWKVENTGSVGEVNLKFDGGDDTMTLYIDDDGDFSAGATEVGALNANGEIATTLTHGTYFTLIIAAEPLTTWTGTTDSDWETTTNWTDGVPTATHDVIIPKTTNQPTAATAVTVNKVTIDSGASLIANAAFSGNVIYNREIEYASGNSAGWYLMASPVAGQTYDDAFVTANDIAEGTGNNRGIATFNPLADTWNYHQSGGTAGTFTSGQGYAIKKQTGPGAISFTGTLNDADVSVILINTGRGFNLLGNPYTSYLDSVTFLNSEAAISDTQTLWVWNQGTGLYEVQTIADTFTIAPGQGFFVKANTGPNPAFNFSQTNQSHSATDTFQKSQKTQIKLDISDGAIENYCKIYYSPETTAGFDVGYDGELFSGAPNPFAIYTHLVSDSQGKHYQIQSLPYSDIENMVIPVGINAVSGREITITADVTNFPAGVHLYLEDKLENSFTKLDENDAKYTVTLSDDLEGIGRFFLRASSSDLGDFSTSLENISVYTSSKNNLRIVGIQEGDVKLKAYNILGAKIINTSFKGNGKNDVAIPSLAAGIYIIHLEMATGKISKKLVVE